MAISVANFGSESDCSQLLDKFGESLSSFLLVYMIVNLELPKSDTLWKANQL